MARQRFEFVIPGGILAAEADFRTALYEMVSEIAGQDCYRIGTVAALKRPGDVVIDAGANIGIASLVLARRLDCPVVALEPVAENRVWMESNLALNSEDRVKVLACGLAGSDRMDRLWQDPHQSVSAHFSDIATRDRPSGLQCIPAEFLSLPSLFSREGIEHVLLLKLDIEGGEHEVFASLDPSTAARIRFISMEVHDLGVGRNVHALTGRLRALGYEVEVVKRDAPRRGLSFLFARRSP